MISRTGKIAACFTGLLMSGLLWAEDSSPTIHSINNDATTTAPASETVQPGSAVKSSSGTATPQRHSRKHPSARKPSQSSSGSEAGKVSSGAAPSRDTGVNP